MLKGNKKNQGGFTAFRANVCKRRLLRLNKVVLKSLHWLANFKMSFTGLAFSLF